MKASRALVPRPREKADPIRRTREHVVTSETRVMNSGPKIEDDDDEYENDFRIVNAQR
jgi:hypothetical protein